MKVCNKQLPMKVEGFCRDRVRRRYAYPVVPAFDNAGGRKSCCNNECREDSDCEEELVHSATQIL